MLGSPFAPEFKATFFNHLISNRVDISTLLVGLLNLFLNCSRMWVERGLQFIRLLNPIDGYNFYGLTDFLRFLIQQFTFMTNYCERLKQSPACAMGVLWFYLFHTFVSLRETRLNTEYSMLVSHLLFQLVHRSVLLESWQKVLCTGKCSWWINTLPFITWATMAFWPKETHCSETEMTDVQIHHKGRLARGEPFTPGNQKEPQRREVRSFVVSFWKLDSYTHLLFPSHMVIMRFSATCVVSIWWLLLFLLNLFQKAETSHEMVLTENRKISDYM